MGANTSQISDLSNNQSLKTLVGTESISENDPFWNQLISFTFISPTSRYTHVEQVELSLYSQNGIFLECGFPAQAWRDLFRQCDLPLLLSTVCQFAVNHDRIVLPFSTLQRQMFS